jgi:hypothetical protein
MEAIIVHPKDKEQLSAFKKFFKTMNVPFEIRKEEEEKPYNPEFVAKIMRSREDSKQGRVTVIKTEDLWK